MNKACCTFIALVCVCSFGYSQSNIVVSEPIAEEIILGTHNPSNFPGLDTVSGHEFVLCDIQDKLSTDSMLSYLEDLQEFHTRHTHSDTVSNSTGIGAARRWAFQKMKSFSDNGSGRLVPAYLQFDHLTGSCGPDFGLKNVLGVLPGADVSEHKVILVQAHMDSRCAVACDSACFAPGMEDNGSGTALVIELARVMSEHVYDHSIIFMLTIGEEQGLLGAEAMAEYCNVNNVPLKAALNNDVVGGILCGTTSSPPSCPGLGHVDSLQLRLFSSAGNFQRSRNTVRTVKMYYDEKIVNVVDVPMTISIMNQEDRTGRGGDHIPFRVKGFRSIRFTSANEHGSANVADTSYSDRQHTSGDILGIDTTGNTQIDQYYVDLNYLKRNAMINGSSIALLALGPKVPTFTLHDEAAGLRISIQSDPDFAEYRIGVRTSSNSLEFDEVYRTSDTSFVIPGQVASTSRRISVATIDHEHIMSPFSEEATAVSDASTPAGAMDMLPYGIDCSTVGIGEYQNDQAAFTLRAHPNPWSGSTTITVVQHEHGASKAANVVLRDVHGRIQGSAFIVLSYGVNHVNFSKALRAGVYYYSLVVDGVRITSEKMLKLN